VGPEVISLKGPDVIPPYICNMNKLILLFLVLFAGNSKRESLPTFIKGKFIDDYGIQYTISDSLWTQHPNANYHIIRCNEKEKYLILRNDDKNPSDPGLYSRIDFMPFEGMDPWKWGFCLSVYNAKSDSSAEKGYKADKLNPRKGCNGFPFSRMKSSN